MKQMRITHSGGFSKAEREQWRHIIFHNLIDAFRNILIIMQEFEIEFEDDTNIVFTDFQLPHLSVASECKGQC